VTETGEKKENLVFSLAEVKNLLELFKNDGIISIGLVQHQNTNKSKGFCFAYFEFPLGRMKKIMNNPPSFMKSKLSIDYLKFSAKRNNNEK